MSPVTAVISAPSAFMLVQSPPIDGDIVWRGQSLGVVRAEDHGNSTHAQRLPGTYSPTCNPRRRPGHMGRSRGRPSSAMRFRCWANTWRRDALMHQLIQLLLRLLPWQTSVVVDAAAEEKLQAQSPLFSVIVYTFYITTQFELFN